jgi:peptidoglycan hydrolase-like protein with peptidoglycan-binding domain
MISLFKRYLRFLAPLRFGTWVLLWFLIHATVHADNLLDNDLAALLKSHMSLSKSSAVYYPGTVAWIQDQLQAIALAEPEWKIPVAGMTAGVFDERTAGAVKAFQQKLGMSKPTGQVDADTTRALISLLDYSKRRASVSNIAKLSPDQALQKNLLWGLELQSFFLC